MLRAGELQAGDRQQESAQYLLQIVRGALPLIGAVRESERWEIQGPAAEKRPFPKNAAFLSLSGLAVLLCSSAYGGGLFFRILWCLAGGFLIFLGGLLYGKEQAPEILGKGNASVPQGEVRERYLIDAEDTYHCLKGILLTADHCLETEKARVLSGGESLSEEGPLSFEETELFSSLLESAYAARRKEPGIGPVYSQISEISYYLHRRGVEVLDYEETSARHFEILPSPVTETLTIRPALLSGEMVLRKGLAAMAI